MDGGDGGPSCGDLSMRGPKVWRPGPRPRPCQGLWSSGTATCCDEVLVFAAPRAWLLRRTLLERHVVLATVTSHGIKLFSYSGRANGFSHHISPRTCVPV